MAGIAEQSDASLRPLLHRATHHQRPFVGGVDVVNESVDVLMPVAEVAGELAFAALYGPGFHLPVSAFDDADEVHEFAAPYRVMQHVTAWSEPIRSDHSCKVRRQPIHRHQAAPGHATRELGLASAE